MWFLDKEWGFSNPYKYRELTYYSVFSDLLIFSRCLWFALVQWEWKHSEQMMELSQQALGSICLPRDKGRVGRRKITELGIARHWEQRAEREAGHEQRWEWGGGRSSSPWAGRVWQKGACHQQRGWGGSKGQPYPHPHQILRMLCCRISVGRHDSACQDVHVLELDTVTRYWISCSSRSPEYFLLSPQGTSSSLKCIFCSRKRLEKINYEYPLPKILILNTRFNAKNMLFHSNSKLSINKSFKMNKPNYCFSNNLPLCSDIHLASGHCYAFSSLFKENLQKLF